MKVRVNEDCISCGMCMNICPEVFDYGADGLSTVIGDPNKHADAVMSAVEACPTNAIEVIG